MKTLVVKKVIIPLIFVSAYVVVGLWNSQLGTDVDLGGKVIKLNDGWGIRASWDPFRPFAVRNYTVIKLPKELQVDQRAIRGLFAVKNSTGKGKWSVVISPISL